MRGNVDLIFALVNVLFCLYFQYMTLIMRSEHYRTIMRSYIVALKSIVLHVELIDLIKNGMKLLKIKILFCNDIQDLEINICFAKCLFLNIMLF